MCFIMMTEAIFRDLGLLPHQLLACLCLFSLLSYQPGLSGQTADYCTIPKDGEAWGWGEMTWGGLCLDWVTVPSQEIALPVKGVFSHL